MKDQVSVKDDGENTDHTRPLRTAGKTSPRSLSSHRHRDGRRLISADITREDALRRLLTFHRLARLIADCENDIDGLAQAAAQLTSEVIGDMSVVTLLNAHGETYHIAAYHDPDPEVVSLFEQTLQEVGNIPSDQGWVARVISSGQPLLMPAITVEQANTAAVPAFMEFTRRVGIAGILIVPISCRSGTLGTIALTRHQAGQPYDETSQQFLMEIGYRIGLAIESAMLVESLRKEVAARLLAKEALAGSEERFLSIFRSTALGIKVMDVIGTILETNSAFQAMTGYGEEDFIAMQFYDIVHPDDIARVVEVFTAIKLGSGPKPPVEHRLIGKDGSTIWVRTTFAGVKKGPEDPTLTLIFGIAENITERKQADAELAELRKHLQRSIELERLRLAQNLHDTPLQELYAVIYKLEELRPTTRPATAEIVGQVITDIKHTLDGLRATASELRPPALSRFGLEKAVRSYAEDFRLKHPQLRLELSLARDRQFLSEELRLVLFRVFQEALANVARHAQASEVHVRFSFDAEEARLEVSDNGRGFIVPNNWMASLREGHYGLAGMAERVSAAGGVLTLDSKPEGPTTVRAVIPC